MTGWQTANDLALQGVLSTFGESVTYTPAVGSPRTITGIFHNAHVEVHPGGVEIGSSSVHPVIQIRLADLAAAPAKSDTVTRNGVTYKVIDSIPDGDGGAKLVLQKQ